MRHHIILASKSPRRRYLLEQAGLSIEVIPGSFDESSVKFSIPEEYVKTLAEAKATDIAKKYPKSWVIGADTIVMIKNRMLGKPRNIKEARCMLRGLSGQVHQVFTGFCIRRESDRRIVSDAVVTDVLFKHLTEEEIEWYVHTKEPFDKAGAYAIQGLGSFLVKRINGSYTNVVGLPVCEVIECLIKHHAIGMRQRSDE
ncbi:MAG: Maf family protein [Desulfobacterales bacterium]